MRCLRTFPRFDHQSCTPFSLTVLHGGSTVGWVIGRVADARGELNRTRLSPPGDRKALGSGERATRIVSRRRYDLFRICVDRQIF
jgi:hypothetical protein